LAASRSEDDQRLAEWLVDPDFLNARPSPSHETLRLEAELREARREHGAATADASCPRGKSSHARVTELSRLSFAQRGALYRAAVEAARERLHRHATPAMIARHDGAVRYREPCDRTARPRKWRRSASRGYGRLEDNRSAGRHRSGYAWRARRMWPQQSVSSSRALSPTRMLKLPDPGQPVVERLDPRLIKPPIDGAIFMSDVNKASGTPRDTTAEAGSQVCGRGA